VGHTIPLKPLVDNQALFWVTQRGKLVKAPKTIKTCPFKASRSPKEGWPHDDFGHFDLSPLDQFWELVSKGL